MRNSESLMHRVISLATAGVVTIGAGMVGMTMHIHHDVGDQGPPVVGSCGEPSIPAPPPVLPDDGSGDAPA